MNPTGPAAPRETGMINQSPPPPTMSKRRARLLAVVLIVGVVLNADRIDHLFRLLFGS